MAETQTISPPRKLKYIPAFDGIRGMFCLVIVSHHLPIFFFRVPFAMGWVVLQIFFVMSGYLISMILLNEKAKYGFKDYGKRFYTKRFYRIFPLYFGYLLLMLLFGYLTRNVGALDEIAIWQEMKHFGVFLFTYTYNLKDWFLVDRGLNTYYSPVFAHLWSLSLEEQFYIFFPLVVFFLSEKNLKRFLVLILVISPILRTVGYIYLYANIPDTMPNVPNFDKEVLVGWILHHNTLFQMDSLTMGVCLAVFNFDWIKNPLKWFYFVLAFFVTLMLFNGWLDVRGGHYPTMREALMGINVLSRHYQAIYLFTLCNIMSALLILISFRKDNPFKVFEWKFFVEMGRISYGIYVLHFFLMFIYLVLLKMIHITPSMFFGHIWFELPVVIGYYIFVIKISQWSFKYYESYFLNLKAKIDSQKTALKISPEKPG